MRQTRLLRWLRWTTGALLLPIIAIPIVAAAQGRHLHLVSTAWSPFTNAPEQLRLALDLVGVALERAGIIAATVIVDEARLTPSLLSGEFDGSAALWRDTERERPQWSLENRPTMVTSKPANGHGPGRCSSTPFVGESASPFWCANSEART